jgi:hypothetical protein
MSARLARNRCSRCPEWAFSLAGIRNQLNAIARHLQPIYDALGRRALESPVVHVDETRWAIMGSAKPAAGTVWTVRAPTVSFYRILPGKSAAEGRQVLGGYRGTGLSGASGGGRRCLYRSALVVDGEDRDRPGASGATRGPGPKTRFDRRRSSSATIAGVLIKIH